MKLSESTAEIWIPDGATEADALKRVTHMSIAAHQDDVEIMALDGILAGFGSREKWFMAVIVTNGAGSPRDGIYASYDDQQMQEVRRLEQKKAAYVGEYSAVAFLNHPSLEIKSAKATAPKEDLKALIAASRPEVIYTHNLADKHDTHIGVTLRTISAIRELPTDQRPKKLYGCEVWRDLDWLVDTDKVVFELDAHENIAVSLVGVFDSQIAGGKRYDHATMGRRRANATYFQSHSVDAAQMINFGIDLTPLIQNDKLDPAEYIAEFTKRFADDVNARVKKFS
ncbi:MAG TPA: PIG-L family deacetylase [Terriglobales bacterium]|jgi:LmbE family N-acetylglucosaminyl deacetylase|nr:PIG-L family deacetylase [Terriglobales bacterium]